MDPSNVLFLNNYMERVPLDELIVAQQLNRFPVLFETRPLPCSHEPATGPYHVSNEYTQRSETSSSRI
jgi:hypothetical protein